MKREIKFEVINQQQFEMIDEFYLNNIIDVYEESITKACKGNFAKELNIISTECVDDKRRIVSDVLKAYWKQFLFGDVEEEKFIVQARMYIGGKASKIIGIARFIRSATTDYKWMIEGLEIVKGKRRKGIGEGIIKKGIEVIERKQEHIVYSNIEKYNVKSMKLHEKIGFSRTEHTPIDSLGKENNDSIRYEMFI